MMLDWISVRSVAPQAQIAYRSDLIQRISPEGELRWETAARESERGSHDSSMALRWPDPTRLELSGNPAKFLWGHNLWGPADWRGQYFDVLTVLNGCGGQAPSLEEFEAWQMAIEAVTRLDLTRTYDAGSAAEARQLIEWIGRTGQSRHRNSVYRDGTAYFGLASRRWTAKLYHKGDEILARSKGHQLPTTLPRREELTEWAQGKIRAEIQLRSKELQKWNLDETCPLDIWSHQWRQIAMNGNATAFEVTDEEKALPRHLQLTLGAWRAGRDLRELMTRPTFYRQRAEIRRALNIDIAAEPPKARPSKGLSAEFDDDRWDPEIPAELQRRPGPPLPARAPRHREH